MPQALRQQNQRNPVEAAIRRDLAACYRLVAHFGWDDLLANHISARLPGPEDAFLINPFGILFEEVTASSLIKIDMDGRMLEPCDYKVNPAGFVIHSAIHQARPEVGCVIHLHSKDGVAVSSTAAGVLPLNQTAMLFYQDLAFHEFEGIATSLDERARLQVDLGNHNYMLLRNHGTLTVGESIASAFYRMYWFETACTIQVRTLSMNAALHAAPQAALDKVGEQANETAIERFSLDLAWPTLLRKVARLYPDYAD
ncbi:MAG: class II aldolase/adducin family protein [Rhodospirillaceae bacterium]|nr:MAG: class II aldolase/adducin family protein [Rhodospirillaceae bacterium]